MEKNRRSKVRLFHSKSFSDVSMAEIWTNLRQLEKPKG